MNEIYSILNFEAGERPRVPNSPRTLEACLRSGIAPESLLPKPLKDFKQKGIPLARDGVARAKYEHYEMRRQERIQIINTERVSICQYLSAVKSGGAMDEAMLSKKTNFNVTMNETKVVTATVKFDPSKSTKSNAVASPTGALKSKAAELKSSMLENEMKRFESMKRRQEKEIKRIVANEKQMGELQRKLLKAENDDAIRKKEHAKRVAALKAQALEKKRARENEKKQRDEGELARRRELAKKEAEFEIAKAKRERKMEKVRAREAMEREMERRRLLEAQAAKTAGIMKQQERMAEDSRLKMEAKARKVQENQERKRESKHKEIEEARLKAEQKIHTVVAMNKKIQADKRKAFDNKQAEIARFKRENAEVVRKRTEEAAKKLADKHERQRQRQEEAQNKLFDRKQRIIKQLEDKEQFKYVVEAERAEEMAIRQLRMELKKEDKRQNVERIRRMDEFMRLQVKQKMEEDDSRTASIREQKSQLLFERRQMQHENFLRKTAVKEAMDQMKVTNKFIDIEEVLAKKAGGKSKKNGANDSWEEDSDDEGGRSGMY
ncbi:hypothetical protein TrLO_g11817 [Triparma laevis f. longispina]|uniref:Uncharacterized protein n=1 Tax=Triparma laevis f. longispina TaxID=1714387 RepID=A0A9W7CIW3_9STRA|nr:hypothetical protein TrLO_g11817 [Triparma laevis f. longispina]